MTLEELLVGDTNYVGKLNANFEQIGGALTTIIEATSASTPSQLPMALQALFGVPTSVIGATSYACELIGLTKVRVQPGFAWCAAKQQVCKLASVIDVDLALKTAGTYYIVPSTGGIPEAQESSQDALYSVVWNGSETSSLLLIAEVAWGHSTWTAAKSSGVLARDFLELDDRLEAIEESSTGFQTINLAAADVELTETEAMAGALIRVVGLLPAERVLTVPAGKEKLFIFESACTGGFGFVVKTPSDGGLLIADGEVAIVYSYGNSVKRVGGAGAGTAGSFVALDDVPTSYVGQAGQIVQVNATEDGLEFGPSVSPGAFVGLSDVPASYTGQAGKLLQVNGTEDGLEYGDSAPTMFAGLGDTPADYADAAGKRVVVNADEDGLEFEPNTLIGLEDFPASYASHAGKAVRVNLDGNGLDFANFAPPSTFPGLSDTPDTYVGEATKFVRVKGDESGLEFSTGSGAVVFPDLSDVPNDYTGSAGKVLQVNVGETGLEFGDASPATLLGLSDFPDSFAGQAGRVIVVNPSEDGVEYSDAAAPSQFVGLEDVPGSYAGEAGKFPQVNAGEAGLEFVELFLQMVSDVDAYAGNEGKVLAVKSTGDGTEWIDRDYLAGFSVIGQPGDGATLLFIPFAVTVVFPLDFAGSYLVSKVAADADAVFDILKNGVSIGEATFAAGDDFATFDVAGGVTFDPGDTLEIVAPSPQDADLATVGAALKGVRG